MTGLSPTGDGRIYCNQSSGALAPLGWFDAQNGYHVLFASDGVTPMRIDGTSYYQIPLPASGLLDPAAIQGLAISNGLRVEIG